MPINFFFSDLRPFLKGIMFHTVDLTNITRDSNTWKELKILMESAIKQKVIKPLPSIMFKADEAEKAFRYRCLMLVMDRVRLTGL